MIDTITPTSFLCRLLLTMAFVYHQITRGLHIRIIVCIPFTAQLAPYAECDLNVQRTFLLLISPFLWIIAVVLRPFVSSFVVRCSASFLVVYKVGWELHEELVGYYVIRRLYLYVYFKRYPPQS
jgi:hypothetical protein